MIRVIVVATKELPSIDLEFAVRTYEQRFENCMQVDRSEEAVDLSDLPYRKTTFGKQYLADAILELGIQMKKKPNQVIIMLTSEDIYSSGMNYVFGIAGIGAALISSARINPSFWKGFDEIYRYAKEGRSFFEKQYRKVLLHELGHALGLPHCGRWTCVMRYSNSPFELYRKGDDYCDSCWNRFLFILGREESKFRYIV